MFMLITCDSYTPASEKKMQTYKVVTIIIQPVYVGDIGKHNTQWRTKGFN